MEKKKLNTQEAAEFLGVKANTLEIWRHQKRGPNYSKLGSRVLYDVESLDAYYQNNNVHTIDTAPNLRGNK